MALIDSSYFVGPVNIPNTDKTEILERVNFFTDKYQKEILLDLFGYELYKIFDSETSDFDPDGSNGTILQRWMDLIEGVEFTNQKGELDKFDGLIPIVGNYVYWMLIKNNHTQTVGLGEVAAAAENAILANPAEKLVMAWNEMSEGIQKLYELFVVVSEATYPELKDNYSIMRYTYYRINTFGF